MYKRSIIFGGLAASLVLLVAGWIVFGHKDGASQSQSDFDWKRAMVRRGTEELRNDEHGQTHRFVFMQGAPEAMPEKMRRAIAVSVGEVSPLGLRFDRAHHLHTAMGNGIWVVEGDGVTCISSAQSGATACDTSWDAWRRGLVLEVYKAAASPRARPTDFLVLGVVPNWAGAAQMRIGAVTRIVQAPNSVYGLRADTPIKVVGAVR